MTHRDGTAGETEPHEFGERIRRVVASLSDRFDGGLEDEQGAGTITDAAARSLGAMLERFGPDAGTRRLVGTVGSDELTSPGEHVVLSANLGVIASGGATARFQVGGVPAGAAEVHGSGEVYVVVEAPAPGLHTVDVTVCDSHDRVVSELAGQGVLQVASGRPVVLVHAELLLPTSSASASAAKEADSLSAALTALETEGFELAYFDVHEKSRDALIHDEIRKRQLPPGAALAYSAEHEELQSLGVDFTRMFASTAVRHLRAKGVPVTTMLTKHTGAADEVRAEHIRLMTPADALRRATARSCGVEFREAAELVQARSLSSSLDWRLDQTTESHVVMGNSFHAEFDNGEARRTLFSALGAARSTIHLQFYIVSPSLFTEQLVVLLIRRARAGVKVRLMVDALYSEDEVLGRVNPSIISLRAEPNVEVLAVDPIAMFDSVDVSRLKVRDHRKLTIIDGRSAFVSGRNAGDQYFSGFDEVPVHDNTRHESIPWLDAHVEVSGPLVREVQQTFLTTWEQQRGTAIDHDEAVLPPLESVGAASGRMIVHRGMSETNSLAMYLAMFEAAERHVYIVNDFPFVPALERALFGLLARGVEVKLLTGSATARRDDGTFFPAPMHRTLFEFMVKARLEPLLAAGVRAFEFVPPTNTNVVARGGRIRPYVHAKVVSVDGVATSIGSANLDATASYWESEANIVVQDADFSTGVEAALQKLIDGSMELDLDSDYWRRESAQRAVVSTLWPRALYS
ncbi:MAG: phosphatidylserine/phosphatidylglycerophosphate/cardiolipin synthase-like enzyme [Bradymonadia bacterium]|jgi:phosphatidylserine/phosphatidylglycerophosphate/cardiolipin synthase-like enzyme